MMRTPRSAALALALAAAGGCTPGASDNAAPTRAPHAAPAPASPAAARTPAAGAAGAMVHGNHIPKHGGTVLMNGDLHFEVVLDRDGRYRVYFSDAARNDLPAAMASNVTITVTRTGGAPEAVPLRIDDAGESWVGEGAPVTDPDAVARIAYAFQGHPYWIDLAFSVQDATVPTPPSAKGKGGAPRRRPHEADERGSSRSGASATAARASPEPLRSAETLSSSAGGGAPARKKKVGPRARYEEVIRRATCAAHVSSSAAASCP